jgi:hypothetical protein
MLLVLGLNSAFVNAQVVNCQFQGGMHCNAFAGSSLIGWVTHDGHFSNVSIPGTRAVCCRNVDIGTGTPSFNYSTDGHVSVRSTTTNFFHNVSLGFQDTCNVQSTACNNAVGEMCIFRVNTTGGVASNSHIAECASGDLDSYLCCRITEDCSNGIDDDGDGFIDCADEECHKTATDPIPKECSPSPFNSSTCVSLMKTWPPQQDQPPTYVIVNNSACIGSDNQVYHCAPTKDASPSRCCAYGSYPIHTPFGWDCIGSDPCGLMNPYPCRENFDIRNDRYAWFNQPFIDYTLNWCHSRMPPGYYNPDSSINRSTACCFMVKDAKVDFFTDPNNVKIYGNSS